MGNRIFDPSIHPNLLIRLKSPNDRESMTPKQQQQRGMWLISALRRERVVRAMELIRQGADLSVRSQDGDTALYTALAFLCYPVVAPLLEAGADPNVPNADGSYPIHVAAEYGGAEGPRLMEALLLHGAQIDARDEEGATAIFLAGKSACAETVHTLQRYGADVSDRNNQMDTALTFACCWGDTERAAMLLDAGIDLNAQDDCGMNALHWAAKGGHAGTVALLVGRGALLNVADRSGYTALMYAAGHGSRRCVECLLDAGADPAARDGDGRSALEFARLYAGRDLVEALSAEHACPTSPVFAEHLTVERITTPAGEPAVRVSQLDKYGAGWSHALCDGFDAIERMLVQHVSESRSEDST